MNVLHDSKRAAILAALCEGASIRATARMVRVSRTTVLKLLVEAGELCALYLDLKLRNLSSLRLEVDEIWAFVGAKAKKATQAGHGDLWTFTAIDSDSKLLVSYLVGQRTPENAVTFMHDVAARLANRVQLTTDGHRMYLSAVGAAFGWQDVDYAMLVKYYETRGHGPQGRFSPGTCTGTERHVVSGTPDPRKISTSYIERSNLTIRMQNRRFTRLTNAFSKKAENHAHAFALFAMYYNFCRVHQTLTRDAGGVHRTPAMAAGMADRVWKVEDMLALMDPATQIG